MGQISIIDAENFRKQLGEKPIILDVRSEAEIEAYHIEHDHIAMPLHALDVQKLKEHKSDKIYILCKVGARAMKAAEFLAYAGFEKLVVVDGGINSCKDCGFKIDGENINPSDEDMQTLMQEAQKSVQKFMS